jgi:PhoPQ-activated pathogenicity-related protein
MYNRFCAQWVMLLAFGLGALWPVFAGATALDDYIAAPDASYTFNIQSSQHLTNYGVSYTTYQVKMTSQTWRSSAEVNRTLWQHWLTVIVPDVVLTDEVLFIIEGGSNSSSSPTTLEPYTAILVAATGSVMALLEQVPNQPLRFAGESFNRSEDAIIAYSFDKFLQSCDAGTPDLTWPVLLPMAKSAVRGMDTVQTIIAQAPHNLDLDRFVVGGGSKRGWTTWLTTAVDSRVVACCPIVIDVLKMDVQMDHHFKCYGAYSEAIHDYSDLNIFERIGTPAGEALRAIVDPYSYRDRYAMPKFLVCATGDEFFLLDSSRFYYDALPGEKRIRYLPNSGHGIDGDMGNIMSLVQYFGAIAMDTPRPDFSWQFEADGAIRVQCVDAPTSVKLWQATNPNVRDFRWYGGSGPHWTSSTLTEETPGSREYVGRATPPETGWKAYMVELSFPGGFTFSTEVRITPYMRPFDDLDEDGLEDPVDDDDDCDGLADGWDLYPWDSDNDGIPNYLDPLDDRLPEEIPLDCLTAVEGEGMLEGVIEGEGAVEGLPEGVFEGEGMLEGEGTVEGLPEGILEGEGMFEGLPEGVIEGEGALEGEGATEGLPEGVIEGEGAIEGLPEGVLEGEGLIEGEGAMEGLPEGVFEGEGTVEGEGAVEGLPEGIVEGEGTIEGLPEGMVEGEGAIEGLPEGVIEGEGAAEGQPEGVVEGEGAIEGLPEGVVEGEGAAEGQPEGVVEGEGAIEGEPPLEGQIEGEGEGGLPPIHSADQDGNGRINLTELLRVIQFFNIRGYQCAVAPASSEDGYLAGAGAGHDCAPHCSDYAPQDWQIDLTELLRLIQFFNIGGYHACAESGTEDGYCAGP